MSAAMAHVAHTNEMAADEFGLAAPFGMAAVSAPGAPRKLPARERPDVLALLAEVEAATPPHVVGSAWVCSMGDMEARPIDDLCARMAALLAEGAYDLASRVAEARLLKEEHWAMLLQWAIGYTEGGSMEPREHSGRVLRIVFGGATTLAIAAVASACVRVTDKPPAWTGASGLSSAGSGPAGRKKAVDYKRAEPAPFAGTRPSELALLPASYFRMAGGAGDVLEADGVERLHTEFGFPRDARTSRILRILAEHAFLLAPLTDAELRDVRRQLLMPTDDSGTPTFSFGPFGNA
jgi:hypothetical protein